MIKEGELDFYFKQPEIDVNKMVWKNDTFSTTLSNLENVYHIIYNIDGEFNSTSIKNSLWGYAEENGKGSVLWPLRYALSGREKSPDPFTLLEVIGKDKSLISISVAINELKKQINHENK